MCSTRPTSLNSSGHRRGYYYYWCRSDFFRSLSSAGRYCRSDLSRGLSSAGRYWLRRCRARCWYVPSGLTIEATSKPLQLIGSIAAGLQASIGNAAAGSLFALAQSIAMGGGVPAVITYVGGVGAGAAVVI